MKKKKKEQSLRKLWDDTKKFNICVVRASDGEENERDAEKAFQAIMSKNFPIR